MFRDLSYGFRHARLFGDDEVSGHAASEGASDRYMERRWLRWGFTAEPVPDPWGDRLPGEHGWLLEENDSFDELRRRLAEQQEHTHAIVSGAQLGEYARVGGRFSTAEECPTLAWTLFHVLQEYVRHAGQLDVARELTDGVTGE